MLAADGLSLLDCGSDVIAIDARRGSPDARVLDEMARAAQIHSELRARGLEIRFYSPDDGPPEVALWKDGAPVRTLTAAQAAEIAAGRTRP